jgi:hypothetical protein
VALDPLVEHVDLGRLDELGPERGDLPEELLGLAEGLDRARVVACDALGCRGGDRRIVASDEDRERRGIAALRRDVAPVAGDSSRGVERGEETGAPDETPLTAEPVPEPDGSLLLEGLTRLDEFEEVTGLRVAPDLRAEVDTVGGLVMAALGRLPQVGDEVGLDGRTLRVEALDGRRIAAIRLLPTEASPEPVGTDGAAGPVDASTRGDRGT